MNLLKGGAWIGALLVGAAVFAAASNVDGAGRSASGDERLATVARVIDGDTFVTSDGARIRVRNFDTPELRGHACPEERAAAEGARRAARQLLTAQTVRLRVSNQDRYGRLVADVAVLRGDGELDFVSTMVATGHGARWEYGRERQPIWCPQLASR
ncbi:MAG: thermonuclease family protein [Pseudomonadota bacterium]